jgi:tetratricopeptide (TPR) repeat protein
MRRVYLFFIIIAISFFEIPAYTATLNDEITAYHQGNYSKVIEIGKQLDSEEFHTPSFRYYLANAYSKIGQIENAIKEYSICQHLTNDPELKQYCEQALSFLLNSKSVVQIPTSNKQTISQIPIINVANNRENESQDLIHSIQKNAQAAIDSIPRYCYDEFNHGFRNPDFNDTVTKIRTQEKIDIETIRVSMLLDNLNPKIEIPNSQLLTPQYNNLPGYQKKPAYDKNAYIDQLFNSTPFPPPPFPASALKGAQKALGKKIN